MEPGTSAAPSPGFVYLLRCRDLSFYVGTSDDVAARVETHNAGSGPDYTPRRRPVRLLHQEEHPDRASARRREIEIKGWRREKKLAWAQGLAHPRALPRLRDR